MKNIQFLQIDFNLITDTKITSNEFRIYAYLLILFIKSVEIIHAYYISN